MMPNKINQLLDKYEEGNTTLLEEQLLKDYFSNNHVAPEHSGYQSMFSYFQTAAKDTLVLDRSFVQVTKKSSVVTFKRVVAVAVVGLLGFTLYNQQVPSEEEQARLAYHKTKKALEMLSLHFNKGANQMVHLQEFEQVESKYFKNNNY